MHSGHRDFLVRSISTYSEQIGRNIEEITVGLNSDMFLNGLKGVERPFFSFDWRQQDMLDFLSQLSIPNFSVLDEEDVDLGKHKVVVLEGGVMEKKWSEKYDILPIPETGGQHTSNIGKNIEQEKEKSNCDMIQIGAVLIRDGDIITQGHNGSSKVGECEKEQVFFSAENEGGRKNLSIGVPCNSPHAEMVAIEEAKVGDDLIVSISPCIECARAIVEKGIRRVVYLEYYYDKNPGIDILREAQVDVRKAGI